MVEIFLDKEAGFCFGVRRALCLAEEALAKGGGPVYVLGPLIHNPLVVADLEARGLKTISSVAEVNGGRVLIRSHGAPPAVYRTAREKGLELVDATCPLVKRAQRAASLLRREGYRVIVVGAAEHPEVEGIRAYGGEETRIVRDVGDLGKQPVSGKVGLLVQTTQSAETFRRVARTLLGLVEEELRVFNTLCPFTSDRQREAEELAKRTEVMLVVGGRNSANTARLADICLRCQPATFLIETAEEVEGEWFEGKEKIGITAGASTPPWTIEEVRRKVQGLLNFSA